MHARAVALDPGDARGHLHPGGPDDGHPGRRRAAGGRHRGLRRLPARLERHVADPRDDPQALRHLLTCPLGSRAAPITRGGPFMGIDEVVERMTVLAEELRKDGDGRLAFHNTYLRTTEAVAQALRDGFFADPDWVDRWDVAFARLYLDALDADRRGEPVPEPWAVAFRAAVAQPDMPAVRHVLLGMNAHINYDLPQALLAVITDAEFADPAVRARREADHRRIDEVLAVRVGAEDAELQQLNPVTTWQDRALQPVNRMATRRFLRESRAKVWANALELSRARKAGPDAYQSRLARLEKLCGRRVADLVRPGPVLLRLAAGGFGVRLAGDRQRTAYGGDRQRTAYGGDRASTGSRGLHSFDPVKV